MCLIPSQVTGFPFLILATNIERKPKEYRPNALRTTCFFRYISVSTPYQSFPCVYLRAWLLSLCQLGKYCPSGQNPWAYCQRRALGNQVNISPIKTTSDCYLETDFREEVDTFFPSCCLRCKWSPCFVIPCLWWRLSLLRYARLGWARPRSF